MNPPAPLNSNPLAHRVTLIAAVNDDAVYAQNLGASPAVRAGLPVIDCRHFASASRAYNHGLERCDTPVAVFVHQDVYLPHGWDARLVEVLDALDADAPAWGVAGCYGVDAAGHSLGRTWSTGLQRVVGERLDRPARAAALDELLLVVNLRHPIRFDEDLPGYHLYGTDVCVAADEAGLESWVFDAPVVHNSLPVDRLDRGYWAAYRHLQRKWKRLLPLQTPVRPVTRFAAPLWRRELRRRLRPGADRRPTFERLSDPATVRLT